MHVAGLQQFSRTGREELPHFWLWLAHDVWNAVSVCSRGGSEDGVQRLCAEGHVWGMGILDGRLLLRSILQRNVASGGV